MRFDTNRLDRHLVALTLVVLVGAALRLYGLGAESMWVDEVITYRFVTDYSATELLWVIPTKQPHLPLYYVLLDGWVALAGTSAVALRFPSVVFGIFSVPLLYLVGRRLFDRWTGLVAAAILALSPFHLYYAQETRMYSLLTATTLLSFLFLLRLRETPTRGNVAGYLAGTLLTIALHPFGFLVVAAQGLALGIDHWRSGADWFARDAYSTLERTHLFCWGLLVPVFVLGLLKAQSAVDGFDFISPPGPWEVLWTIQAYFATTSDLLALGVFVVVGVAVALSFREFDRERVLVLAWMFVPVLALVAVSYLLTPLFWDRYTIAASPAWFLAVGRGVTSLERRHLRYALAGVLVVAMIPGVVTYHTTTQKEEWDEVATSIDRHAESGDAVLVVDQAGRQALEYYWNRSDVELADAVAGRANDGTPITTAEELRQRVSGHDRVWLVLTHIWFTPGEEARVLDALNDTRSVTRHREYFGVETYLLANQSQSGQ